MGNLRNRNKDIREQLKSLAFETDNLKGEYDETVSELYDEVRKLSTLCLEFEFHEITP